MLALDYVGLATLIGALSGAVVVIANAWWNRPVRRQVEEVHAAVSTPPDTPPLGQVVADTHDLAEAVKEQTNGHDASASS